MTNRQFTIVSVTAVLTLILACVVLGTSLYNRHLEQVIKAKQTEANNLQNDINRGSVSQRLAFNIVQDLGNISANKPDVQALLARYGVTLAKPPPSPSPSPSQQ